MPIKYSSGSAKPSIKSVDATKRVYQEYVTPEVARMIAYSFGRDGTGKTHFAFTAPGPIAYFNNDKDLMGLPKKFKGKKIYEFKSNIIGKPTQDSAREAVELFRKDYRDVVRDKMFRTVVVDNGTILWQMVRMALFGKLKQVASHMYDVANAEMDSLFSLLANTNKNLIVLHQAGKVYTSKTTKDGKEVSRWDGKTWEMKGYGNIDYKPQLGLMHGMTDANDPYAIITKCSADHSMKGMMLSDDLLNFAALATMIYPETDEGNWR